jgi:anthranilate phosphoribosyltransferase
MNTNITNTFLAQGIKAVGIGKRGSKPLEQPLIQDIINELKNQEVSNAAKGAFFGALYYKGLTEYEKQLKQILPIDDAGRLIEALSPEVPNYVKDYGRRLLNKEELNKDEAKKLCQFLMSDLPGDAARGMAASILRVRYETLDEYEGLLEGISETFEPRFKNAVPTGRPIIQISEPFDGVDHSNMITPLLTDYLQNLDYRIVSLVGRNSGPKHGYNLLDIVNSLKGQFLKDPKELNADKPAFGFYIHQAEISKAMDHWVDIRRQIIKRPFMSVLERFVNPVKADIALASAFHPPYGEKMLSIAERAGFLNIIIIRNGIEGGVAFPLKRPAKILCSKKGDNGKYNRHEFEFWAEEEFKLNIAVEERLGNPSLENNVALIEQYKNKGKTDNDLFNLRVKATCHGIHMALEWLNQS